MPSTYGSAHFHFVFSTKQRRPLIAPAWRPRLHAWLAGAVSRSGAFALEVGGVADHVHLLVGLRPTQCPADVLLDWKKGSSRWIHTDCNVPNFVWQDGYAYFTVSRSALPLVRAYIRNQEQHHHRLSYADELAALFAENGVQLH